jgi:exosortase K
MRRIRTKHLPTIFFTALILLAALGLKDYYSRAESSDLLWILRPTAGLLEAACGMAFDHEAGAGFVDRTRRLVIAPSCAGMNFFITVFCMSAFLGVSRLPGTALRLGWICGSLTIAYLSTIAVNAVRITVSYHLYRADIYADWLTPGRVHRAGGAMIYFLSLSALYLVLTKRVDRRCPAAAEGGPFGGARAAAIWLSGAVPAAWYLAAAIAAPMINRAYAKNGGKFVEHGLTVAVVCLAVFALVGLTRLSFCRIADKVAAYRAENKRRAGRMDGRPGRPCAETKQRPPAGRPT